jgi:transcriptional regulator with PAS, ATPase and Fis domain
MPLQIQTKLLRVLQEQVVERIGGKKPIPVDVRVICATNRDLLKMIEENKFRSDLYYRLNVIPIKIPPLRERRGDISILIHHFISEYSMLLNKNVHGITNDAERLLVAYNWPGNVRELKNVIEYLINVVDSDVIKVSDLPTNLLANNSTNIKERSLADIMGGYERMVLENLIKKADTLEKKDNLASQLGISRATLYRKLSNYGLL